VLDLSNITFDSSKKQYVLFEANSSSITFGSDNSTSAIIAVDNTDNFPKATVKVNRADSSTSPNTTFSFKASVYEGDNIPDSPNDAAMATDTELASDDTIQVTFNQSKIAIANIVNQKVIGVDDQSDQVVITVNSYNISETTPTISFSKNDVLTVVGTPTFLDGICTITLDPQEVSVETNVDVTITLDTYSTSCTITVLSNYVVMNDLVASLSSIVGDGLENKHAITVSGFPTDLNDSSLFSITSEDTNTVQIV